MGLGQSALLKTVAMIIVARRRHQHHGLSLCA